MELLIDIDLKKLPVPIRHTDKILLVGSCFTEHIGNTLHNLKFPVLQNPNGILFSPDSVCKSLHSYITNKKYNEDELFQLHEVWHSWQHHSRFSNMDKTDGLKKINTSQEQAHQFLMKADWLIITLGSSFVYELTDQAALALEESGTSVANCHRAPANWFEKKLLSIDAINQMLGECLRDLLKFNPGLKFIFTISPVRHIRDGVVENNRSKARLIESVHHIVTKFENAWYFPAYELLIDVLRDYRFYDIDLVHPNYPATEFVLEKFSTTCIDEPTQQLMKEIRSLVIARKHRAFQPQTSAHKEFLQAHLQKSKELLAKYPYLDLGEEISYFSKA